jgi:hypothetical protein
MEIWGIIGDLACKVSTTKKISYKGRQRQNTTVIKTKKSAIVVLISRRKSYQNVNCCFDKPCINTI